LRTSGEGEFVADAVFHDFRISQRISLFLHGNADHEIESTPILAAGTKLVERWTDIQAIVIMNENYEFEFRVDRPPMRICVGKRFKNSCALCSAAAYCCGAVALSRYRCPPWAFPP